MDKNIASTDITAVILAGGRGSRMGGVDKGLQPFHGVPLALYAAKRIAPQVGAVRINANRNAETYQSFGYPVLTDDDDSYAGPLAGFVVGLAQCQTPYLLTLPCDCPKFPNDLTSRMALGLHKSQADIAMAAQGGFSQPVFCLIKRELLPSLIAFMQSDKRKIDSWTALHKTVLVSFDLPNDDSQAFANANTLQELTALEAAR